jgi:hypothetical protein
MRVCYRIAEFANGIDPSPSNPVPFHEAYSYVLDCFPMMVAFLILAIFHPGRFLVGPGSEMPKLSRDEKKQQKRDRKASKKSRGSSLQGHVTDEYEVPNYPSTERRQDV